MKELQKTFEGKGEVKGVIFTQLKANEYAYIYGRTDGYYEVFKRIENKQFNCISYPKSTSFGIWAWCCSNLQDAEKKFIELSRAKNAEIRHTN